MTVISLTMLMGLVKEAVKEGDEREKADNTGHRDIGRLGVIVH